MYIYNSQSVRIPFSIADKDAINTLLSRCKYI